MNQIQYEWSDILTQITIKMNQLLLESEYSTVCNSQKRVSSILVYLIKILDLFLAAWPQLAHKLTECLKVAVTLVKSNQQQGYTHNFPYFSYVIKKYQRLSYYQDVTFIARQRKIARITKNQESEYYNSISLVKISNQDLQFLHSSKANRLFADIENNRMGFQPTHCVCCSQTFTHSSPIQNSNPLIHFFLHVSPKKAFDNILILRGINGLCNANEGGIMIIGAQIIQGVIKANGIKFKSQQCFNLRQHQIKTLIKSLRPECIFLIQKIQVQSNHIKANLKDDYLRYCIRILIFPKSSRYLTYIESTKNLKKQYEVYIFNQFSMPQRVVGLHLYSNMHLKYRNRIQEQRNYHSNILFLKIHQRSLRTIIPNEIVIEQPSLDKESCLKVSDQQQLQFTDDIDIKFQFQSLLVVSSLSYDKYASTFIQYLQESQLVFQVSRPYSNCFENIRSIWLISHKDKHLLIKTYFKNFLKRSGYKGEEIILMPVYTILQVQSNKFTVFEESILKDRLMGRFNESECFLKKKMKTYDAQSHENKEFTFLKFKNLKRCLYAYMLFEQMRMRPYFIEQSKVNF